MSDRPLTARLRGTAAVASQPLVGLLTEAADAIERLEREATAAEGYDSPAETHRRLVKLLEWVTGTLADHGAVMTPDGAVPVVEVERIETRLTNIIRDMPANRTREGPPPNAFRGQ